MTEPTLDQQLDPPAWPGGPELCDMEGLPFFETQEALLAAHNAPRKTNPVYEGQPLRRVWRCRFCGGWHSEYAYRDPSGASSGTGRGQKHKD